MIVGMTDQAFESTVSGAFDAFNARRFDAFAEYVTEDSRRELPAVRRAPRGEAQQRASFIPVSRSSSLSGGRRNT